MNLIEEKSRRCFIVESMVDATAPQTHGPHLQATSAPDVAATAREIESILKPRIPSRFSANTGQIAFQGR
jgi:hypothetical protein